MTNPVEPIISCLCVTEERPEFMPWLLWCFDRQTYARRELVIVDGSRVPLAIERPDVRVVRVPPATNVAAKRNRAIAAARGAIVAWFDDDDWQSPARLGWLSEHLGRGVAVAGAASGFFVDPLRKTCRPFRAPRGVLFNSAGFRRDAVAGHSFDEKLRRGSDTPWLRGVLDSSGEPAVSPEPLTLWLVHERNLSNRASRRDCRHPLSELRAALRSEDWGDTDAELESLQHRLLEACAERRVPLPSWLRSRGRGARTHG